MLVCQVSLPATQWIKKKKNKTPSKQRATAPRPSQSMQANTTPSVIPVVLLTVSHLNEEEDVRFGGTNFASELWGNRTFSDARGLEREVDGVPDPLLRASLDVLESCLKEVYGRELAAAPKGATCFCSTRTDKFSYHFHSDVVFASVAEHGTFLEYVKDALWSACDDPQHPLHPQAKLLRKPKSFGNLGVVKE